MSPPTLAGAHATEKHLLRLISQERCEPDHTWYRSSDYPTFYDGNFIEVQNAHNRTMAQWQALFCAYFDRSKHGHINVMGLADSGIDQLLPEARALGYEVSRSQYLFADQPLPGGAGLPDELCIREVDSEARWHRLATFDDRTVRDEPWYSPAATAMLHAKTRRLSAAADISWRYVSPRSGDAVLAKLGIFSIRGPHGHVCRLQDVVTAPEHRRRGLATALIADALDETLVRRAADGLFVSADTDYLALDMYRGQGFADVGSLTKLFRMRGPA